VTLKVVTLIAVPTLVVTVTRPVVAPFGTLATIFVAVSDTMTAVLPLKATPTRPERLTRVGEPERAVGDPV